MSQSLNRLIELIGEDATLALIEERGGREIYVPRDPKESSELSRIIGLDAAIVLGQEFAGEAILVPLAREWRIVVYSRQGHKVPEIARLVGCTIGNVKNRRRQHALQQAQFDLFDR